MSFENVNTCKPKTKIDDESLSDELSHLISFISHGNSQIRQSALDLLVPFSCKNPAIFKSNQLLPVRNLIALVRDYKQISKNALIILMNLSLDTEIQELLATDGGLFKTLLSQLANPIEPNVIEISMLLANLSKNHNFKKKFLDQKIIAEPTTFPGKPIDFILDLLVKSTSNSKNQSSNYDHLAYIFSDLTTLTEVRKHLLTLQSYDQIIPLCKLVVFTTHESKIRRLGIACTIKNVCFEVKSHQLLLDSSKNGVGLLPYLLLPLMGGEEYDMDEIKGMLEECQFLPSDKKREESTEIITIHLESLILLTTTKTGRDFLRRIKVYSIVRELHLSVESQSVRDACDRLVNILMRDDEEDTKLSEIESSSVDLSEKPQDDDDDEYKIVEV
ncbi:Protein HGH1-like protein [Erysiphe neolycopersici]|uniref:Protein HGH1 homolog n=1 Tax=Erysiphe neolycopersici TaxID=212602 RepID=A0A420HS29_9PEZI|nr:Protein HGH1-like protein [Erysiphe neolycopersici]